MKKHRTFLALLVARLFLLVLFLSGCNVTSRNNTHVLILAVDQFGFENLKCHKDVPSQAKSGIEILCHDSIRFTHAYTTSQQTRPAIASILTGRYPFANGVLDNDVSFLSAEQKTISEVAHAKGYETAFFVSSPMTLRNSGLQNGFQLFDDLYIGEKTQLFRHFADSKISYLNWRDKQNKPTFALLHVPDLYFTNRKTQTELGEVRNYSYESQFEEFDSNLSKLVMQLKKDNNYDNTLIVLVGLNSQLSEDTVEKQALDVSRDQIALLIKPPQKPRDDGISWTYDENVSLADIGKSFFELFNEPARENPHPLLTTISLFPHLENGHLQKIENRWTVSQTYSHFQNEPNVISLRKNQFHFIQTNNSLHLYNNLIDKLETSPLSMNDPIYKELISETKDLLTEIQKKSIQTLDLAKNEEDLSSLELSLQGKNTDDFFKKIDFKKLNDKCILEMNSFSPLEQIKSCHDKKILFLIELMKDQDPKFDPKFTDTQKKRVQSLVSDMKNLVHAVKINREIGYIQAQPNIELQRWLPFLIALHHPKLAKVKNFIMKPENQ